MGDDNKSKLHEVTKDKAPINTRLGYWPLESWINMAHMCTCAEKN